VTRRTVNGQGATLPADITTALDRQAHGEALAHLGEAHASSLGQEPALALSCREADNLGEADRGTDQPNLVGFSEPGRVLAPASPRPNRSVTRNDATSKG
jgi:hypothetical protein